MIVDAHVHVLPNLVGSERVDDLRRRLRAWMRPWSNALHRAQTFLRHLPEPARRRVDELGPLVPLPGLLVESTADDLAEAMGAAGIDAAVVIAHPPYATNEFILDPCARNPRLVAAVNIPSGTARPGTKLKKYAEKGAKLLKIHGAADGEGVDSPRYRALLRSASDLGLPVILHTGCIHSHLLYKDPDQGQAQRFAPWFAAYPKTRFILAHMNFHEPNIAIDLAEEHSNLYLDTSWQPAEVIGEAVRRIGAERVLFGSDWPMVGHNISVGVSRVRECVSAGTVSEADADLILGANAAKLLRIDHAGAI